MVICALRARVSSRYRQSMRTEYIPAGSEMFDSPMKPSGRRPNDQANDQIPQIHRKEPAESATPENSRNERSNQERQR
jgi:hypothetical protein